MAEQDKGFLGRWSARKAAVKEGKPVAEPVQEKHFDKLSPNGLVSTPTSLPVRAEPVEASAQTSPAAPALTLDDVATLTPASDFSTFVAKGVDSAVKNAAMKKLFADPHYNIMDGLDIYIGDYSTHAPMPQSVIDEITKDGFLNMFQKEEPPPEKALPNDHPDLQLQRDHALGRESALASADLASESPARFEAAQPLVPPPSP
jgi:hypothetical protein